MLPIMMAALFLGAVIALIFSITDDSRAYNNTRAIGSPIISLILSVGVIFSGQNMQVAVYDTLTTTRDAVTTWMGFGMLAFSFVLLLYRIFETPLNTE